MKFIIEFNEQKRAVKQVSFDNLKNDFRMK